jgi:hypothetical protein
MVAQDKSDHDGFVQGWMKLPTAGKVLAAVIVVALVVLGVINGGPE